MGLRQQRTGGPVLVYKYDHPAFVGSSPDTGTDLRRVGVEEEHLFRVGLAFLDGKLDDFVHRARRWRIELVSQLVRARHYSIISERDLTSAGS